MTLSIVFNSRKNAEQSKRARKVLAERAGQSVVHSSEHTVSEAPAASSDHSGDSGLGLRVERRSKDWRVVWNRNAAVNATGGRLSIIDGTIRKNFDLDHEELRKGNILYSPVTDDVV